MVLSPELKQMCELLQKDLDAKCAMGRDDTAGESAGRFGPLGGQFWAFQGSKGGYQRGEKLKSKWREKKRGERRRFCWFCCRQQPRAKLRVREAHFGPNSLPECRIGVHR